MTDGNSVLMLALAVVIVLLAVTAGLLVERRRARQQRQAKGLQWLASLRVLLGHIQKHRGLTTGLLSGNEAGMVAEIEGLQISVSRDLAAIAMVDLSIEENSRWQGITQHWARLAGNYRHAEPENNLTQHNHLIKNILYLIDDLAQECELLYLKNAANKPLHLYWRELLAAAEFIGQARAIGTGVAAAGSCDNVARIRLNFLCEKIQTNTRRLWSEIGCDKEQLGRINRLITCVNEHLMVTEPDISPTDFFDVATDALDSLLEQFDRLIKEQLWQ